MGGGGARCHDAKRAAAQHPDAHGGHHRNDVGTAPLVTVPLVTIAATVTVLARHP